MKIGFWELVVIVIVAFVFIGPDQLPVYAKKIGKMLRELKKYTGAASEEIQKNVVEPLNEIQAPLKEAVAPLTDIKKDIDDSMKDVTKSFTNIGKTSKEEAKKAVEAGYWPLYWYNPDLAKEGKNPFTLDSKPAKTDYKDFIMGEVRYASLKKLFPAVADQLFDRAEKEAENKYEYYKKLSELD